jgi:hypothetical protein
LYSRQLGHIDEDEDGCADKSVLAGEAEIDDRVERV